MNEKELRIGNLVKLVTEGHEHEPELMEWSLEDYEFYSNRTDDIKPIPLTEEWLVKFGFLKTVDDYSGTENVFRKLISIYSSDGVFSLYRYNDVRVYINHVHQLQNLYFALTGEELKIENE